MKKKAYYSHRGRIIHSPSAISRVGHFILPVVLVITLGAYVGTESLTQYKMYEEITFLFGALLVSLARLMGAYLFALTIGVLLGLLAERNHFTESLLLPLFDIFESLPVLAFFPILILFFLNSGWVEGATLFIIFFSMVWNITFSTVGGLKVIPQDIKAVGKAFGLSRWERFGKITLPALFPALVTGSILSLADGWNVLIVAEALHAYAPSTSGIHDLYGIGSVLVAASSSGQSSVLLGAMSILVVVIGLINFVVWQPLLTKSEQYKFE